MNIFSPTSVQLTSSNFRSSTKIKSKLTLRKYGEKDFEDPESNLSLIEAIRLIDGNKKSDAVVEALWGDNENQQYCISKIAKKLRKNLFFDVSKGSLSRFPCSHEKVFHITTRNSK